MKPFLLILPALCFFVGKCYAQLDFLDHYKMKGEVRSVYENTYDIQEYKARGFPVPSPGEQHNSRMLYFDENSQPLSETLLMDGHQVMQELNFERENGQLQRTVMQHLYAKEEIVMSFFYDHNNQLTSAIRMIGADTNYTIQLSYKRQQLKEAVCHYNQRGKQLITSDQYDKKLIRHRQNLDADGNLRSTIAYLYSKEGELIRVEEKNETGLLVGLNEYEYKYDEKGNWIYRINHNKSTGKTIISERIIHYQSTNYKTSLDDLWISGNGALALQKYGDKFAMYDLKEDTGVKGNWRTNDEGGYTVSASEVTPIRMSYYWNNNRRFDATVEEGILVLGKTRGDQLFFYPAAYANIDERIIPYIERKLWEIDNEPSRWDRDANHNYPPKYERLAAGYEYFKVLSPDIAAAQLDGKYCLFHLSGTQITDFKYDYISWNSFDRYAVKQGDSTGIINGQGQVILPIEYQSLRNNWAGFIAAADKSTNTIGVFNEDGKLAIPFEYDRMNMRAFGRIIGEKDRIATMLDFEGNKLTPPAAYRSINPITPNLFMAKGVYGNTTLLDSMGQQIAAVDYKLRGVVHGYFTAQNDLSEKALMNYEGRVLSLFYDKLAFCENPDDYKGVCPGIKQTNAIAMFKDGDRWGYLSGLGREIPPKLPAFGFDDYFYTTVEKDQFSIKYPYDWQERGGRMVHKEYPTAHVSYHLIGFSEEELREQNFQAVQINEQNVWERISRTSMLWQKAIVFPLSNGQFVQINFECPDNQLLLHAQSFWEMEQSVIVKD